MKKMMKWIGLLLLVLCLMAVGVQAQTASSSSYPVYTLSLMSNLVPAGATVTQGVVVAAVTQSVVIAVTKFDEIVLQVKSVVSSNVSGVGLASVVVDYSIDKTNWWAGFSWQWPTTAMVTNTVGTNVAFGAVGYIRLLSFANACTNGCDLKVIHVKWAPKAKRFGDR